MEKKFIYEAPEVEQIELKLECNQTILSSTTGSPDIDGDENLGDIG